MNIRPSQRFRAHYELQRRIAASGHPADGVDLRGQVLFELLERIESLEREVKLLKENKADA